MCPCRCHEGCSRSEHGVQCFDPLVGLVVTVPEPEGWRMGQQYVDRARAPRPPEESPRHPVVLALGVLVGARLVAHAAAEPHDPQARGLDDPLVGVGRAVGARTFFGLVVEEVQTEQVPPRALDRGVVVAGHEHDRARRRRRRRTRCSARAGPRPRARGPAPGREASAQAGSPPRPRSPVLEPSVEPNRVLRGHAHDVDSKTVNVLDEVHASRKHHLAEAMAHE